MLNNQKNSFPIGVFDSGIGGLTVLIELRKKLPNERFIYLGDTARLPYGSKSSTVIRQYSELNIRFLISQKVKAVVIACGSASANFTESFFDETPIFTVIEPGARQALGFSKTKHILVLGTRATIQSQIYTKKIKDIDPNASIKSVACPLFVPLAEEGWDDDPIANLIAYRYIHSVLDAEIDSVILGCTHYPLLEKSIRKVIGNDRVMINSGAAVSELVAAELVRLDLLNTSNNSGKSSLSGSEGDSNEVHIMTTDFNDQFGKMADSILVSNTDSKTKYKLSLVVTV